MIGGNHMVKMPFKPRAQILLQLGEQLIKNENIAVLELVKNSYDADARKVSVNMIEVDKVETGVIEILDDGLGMDIDTVQNIWMEPGNNHKKDIVKNNNRSKLGRLPIGEKGIGRFGVHKLGRVIKLVSKKENCNEVILEIDWNKFEQAEYLSDVEIAIAQREPELFTGGKTGTYLKISALPTPWSRGMVRGLARSLKSLNSPFESQSSFKVDFCCDKDEWLEGIVDYDAIKDFALFKADITIAGNKIKSFNYEFRPYDFMSDINSREVFFSDLLMTKQIRNGKNKKQEDIDLSKYQIGELRLKFYAFDRESNVIRHISEGTAIKKYLDENGGISVFRDGMRVLDYGEPGNDWLGLDLKRVNAPAKSISNNIILGSILINREGSEDLIEKANREGFIENDAFLTFKDAVIFAITHFTAQRNIDKENIRNKMSGGAKEPIKEKISEIRKLIVDTDINKIIKDKLNNSLAKVEDELEYLKSRYVRTANAGLSYGIVIHEIEKIIGELRIEASKKGTSVKIRALSAHLSKVIESYSELLRNKSKRVVEANSIIQQALFAVEYRLDAHKIEVVNLAQAKNGKVNCASNMVVGAIINLIDNSIYWTTYSKKPERKILIDVTDSIDGHVGIVIADNGIGYQIDGEDAIKPFVTTRQDGLGLGLNIVNEIMIAQNGYLFFPDACDYVVPAEFKGGAVTVLALKKET